MKTKHTPGEWRVTDDSEVGQPEKLFVTCRMNGTDIDVCEIVNDHHSDPMANARLLASAPELLDQVLRLITAIVDLPPSEHTQAVEEAWLIVDKARGDVVD